MDAETAFFCGLMELQYGRKVVPHLQELAQRIPWARGWPQDIKAFWNAEAFMWTHKINQQQRTFVKRELQFLHGKTLDIGCGAYSYIPSVGLDFSEKMLQFNENCHTKIVANLEEILPLPNGDFDSVTAVLMLNYISILKVESDELSSFSNPTSRGSKLLYTTTPGSTPNTQTA